uniref:Uncharacterized protein n=1 Tax=Arundo donax TaxID=35708 RepID=A0A0A8YXW6_ARUDO
MAAASRLI